MSRLTIPAFIALLLSLMICTACDDDSSSKPKASTFTIASLADDMRECAPDLATSAITEWANGDNGWSGHVTYGVLRKHFDSSSGTESIYSTVMMLDDMTEQLSTMPAEMFEGDGTYSEGGYTVDYSLVSSNVTLPPILGITVDDFTNHLQITGTSYQSDLYYKTAGSDNTEKIFYSYSNPDNDENGLVFATRDSATDDIEVYTACHKADGPIPASGSAHIDGEFRCLLYFTGNKTDQNFKFRVKTDAADGWAFWGGGSVATDSSTIAVRGTDAADSQTYANDGDGITDNSAATTYVILTFGDMQDAAYDGGGYPKNGTDLLLDAETDPAAGFIQFGDDDCLYADLAAARAFVYPEEADEVTLP